jgi:hypothetical protein
MQLTARLISGSKVRVLVRPPLRTELIGSSSALTFRRVGGSTKRLPPVPVRRECPFPTSFRSRRRRRPPERTAREPPKRRASLPASPIHLPHRPDREPVGYSGQLRPRRGNIGSDRWLPLAKRPRRARRTKGRPNVRITGCRPACRPRLASIHSRGPEATFSLHEDPSEIPRPSPAPKLRRGRSERDPGGQDRQVTAPAPEVASAMADPADNAPHETDLQYMYRLAAGRVRCKQTIDPEEREEARPLQHGRAHARCWARPRQRWSLPPERKSPMRNFRPPSRSNVAGCRPASTREQLHRQ